MNKFPDVVKVLCTLTKHPVEAAEEATSVAINYGHREAVTLNLHAGYWAVDATAWDASGGVSDEKIIIETISWAEAVLAALLFVTERDEEMDKMEAQWEGQPDD